MASKKTFNFKLGDEVKFALSAEKGSVVGRAHYINSDPQYFVRYLAADGRQHEDWIPEDALTAA